ncbi:hypothetical protein OSTOST_11796, partial [Ostertagia ostertagi]
YFSDTLAKYRSELLQIEVLLFLDNSGSVSEERSLRGINKPFLTPTFNRNKKEKKVASGKIPQRPLNWIDGGLRTGIKSPECSIDAYVMAESQCILFPDIMNFGTARIVSTKSPYFAGRLITRVIVDLNSYRRYNGSCDDV